MADKITLYGRVFISGNIELKSGLHIGGSGGAFSIGGVDKPVIADPISGQPYIPGSSLRGKMRSLTEKYLGLELSRVGSGPLLHQPNEEAPYLASPVAQIYGVSADDFTLPTRLIVRDVPLTTESADRLRQARTELPYTEVKTEVAIDRVTSQANPRQIERVPTGAVFGPMELVMSVYYSEDVALLSKLVDGLSLLEDDYLGGSGSRGSGRIAFTNLQVKVKKGNGSVYRASDQQTPEYGTLGELIADFDRLQTSIHEVLFGAS